MLYLMTAGSVLLLILWQEKRRESRAILFFLNLGVATAFFDFLTYPLAALGMTCFGNVLGSAGSVIPFSAARMPTAVPLPSLINGLSAIS